MRTPKQYLGSAQDEGVFGAQPGFQSLALLLGKRTYEDWRFHEDHYSSSHTTYSEYALGPLLGTPLDLVFTPLELVSLGAAVVVTAFIALDGESNWLEGAMLCGVYVIAALTFFFSP